MAATINGKRRPPPKPFASPRLLLSWLLFKLEPELLLPPLPSLCKHALSSNTFTFAAASVPRRRSDFVATGEGLAPPLSFLASWVRQGITKLVLPQVYIPGARRSRAPTTPKWPQTRHDHPLRPPVTCACAPATKCTSLWMFWWPGAPPRGNAGESPPHAAVWITSPAHAPPLHARARPWPSDPLRTAQISRGVPPRARSTVDP
jgi:hypothetical protein